MDKDTEIGFVAHLELGIPSMEFTYVNSIDGIITYRSMTDNEYDENIKRYGI